jgi:hypothetical protein
MMHRLQAPAWVAGPVDVKENPVSQVDNTRLSVNERPLAWCVATSDLKSSGDAPTSALTIRRGHQNTTTGESGAWLTEDLRKAPCGGLRRNRSSALSQIALVVERPGGSLNRRSSR